MDDSFELEYADELDAIDDEDVGPPDYIPPKSKRSLHFATPKGKNGEKVAWDCNDSLSLGIDDPENVLEESAISVPDCDNNISTKVRKRTQLSEDEIDGFMDDLPTLTSSRKRQRLTNVNDEGQTDILPDAAVIEAIQKHRSERSTNVAVSQGIQAGSQPRLNDGEDLERPRVHKRIPRGDFISTVGYEGQRVYLKLWDEEVLEAEYASLGSETRATGLLPTPVCLMREQIEDEQSRKILAEADDLQERVRRQLDETSEVLDITDLESNPNNRGDNADDEDEMSRLTEDMQSLWVEKYAPRKYTELLSNESTNRSLLHWLKLWDYVVFGKDVPKPMSKGKFANKDKDKEQKFKKKFQSEVAEDLDKHNRPQQKIALLCGPPGLGKTTLAHIVAKHAGYNVVEMNASDDRTVDVFRNKLESATQMKSVMEADPRPNCLVIDEIDGAPAPAINVLLNVIKKTENEAAANNKKKKEGGLLLRPIICVCNDQYVPSLRQLKQVALVLNFSQTEPSRLASRLHEVIRVEELKADLNTLLALCERTENDIRSCLNTLQFIRQKQKELTLRDVQTMSVGQKDSQKSLFSVWHNVFTMPRPKKNRFVSIQDLMEGKQDTLQTNNITPAARFQHILHMSQSAGEYDRIMQGLFENYLEAKSKDPNLIGLNLANEWMCFADCTNQYIARSQDYSVMKYSSYLPIIFHFLYASFNPSRIQFPLSQSDANQKQTKTKNLLSSMVSDMCPLVRKFNNPRTLILDLLSPLLDILQPTLRPVNTQLYSSREKEELSSVVRIMIAYNMTYHQEKTLEGQYIYSLDPNVEEVIKFPGLQQKKQLTYAAKQMIAREIELEKMRRSEKPAPKPQPDSNKSESKPKPKASPAVPNHLQKLEAKSLQPDKPNVNFFGNFVRTKREKPIIEDAATVEPKQDKSKKELLDTLIWFHFKEGFSNAVRRNVKVQDLV